MKSAYKNIRKMKLKKRLDIADQLINISFSQEYYKDKVLFQLQETCPRTTKIIEKIFKERPEDSWLGLPYRKMNQ